MREAWRDLRDLGLIHWHEIGSMVAILATGVYSLGWGGSSQVWTVVAMAYVLFTYAERAHRRVAVAMLKWEHEKALQASVRARMAEMAGEMPDLSDVPGTEVSGTWASPRWGHGPFDQDDDGRLLP